MGQGPLQVVCEPFAVARAYLRDYLVVGERVYAYYFQVPKDRTLKEILNEVVL